MDRTPVPQQGNGRETVVTVSSAKELTAITIETRIFVDFKPADNNGKR